MQIMWKSLFNRAARPSYLPERPVVLVSTIGDEEHRGDSHAFVGLGRLVAEKLGGEYRYINSDSIRAAYPETGMTTAYPASLKTLDSALYEYFNDHGVPDIMLSRMSRLADHRYPVFSETKNGLTVQKRPYIVDSMNEVLTRKGCGDADLLSHHLTPTLLATEGEKFAQAYPFLRGPLITVMMADNSKNGLAEALILKIKDMSQSSVFVCSGRRTSSCEFDVMMDLLAQEIGRSYMKNRVRLLGYDFQKAIGTNALNPYIGLINKSDHIIVCGDSGSIVSEALSAQRTIYLHECVKGLYTPMVRDGLVKIFNDSEMPLSTEAVRVVNPTEKTADYIIAGYKKKCRAELGLVRGMASYVMEG